MQNLKLQFKIQKYLIVAVLFFMATPVFGAQLLFNAKTTQVQIDEKFEVKLFVDTEQESINAFEGKIIFSDDILDLKEIRDGNSIVIFWIEKPKNQNGAIVFSGITPGGFSGEMGLIFSVIFEAKKEGVAKLEIKDTRVLRNDGTGSQVPLTILPLEIEISSVASVVPEAVTEIKDIELPESFVPEIAKDETLFEGKWFVVFDTQDKASGIDHYKVKESRQKIFSIFTKWILAESPYILQDQELRSFVWIKVVDKAGNARIGKISPQNPLPWHENYENWLIIILGGFAIVYVIKKFLWKRLIKK